MTEPTADRPAAPPRRAGWQHVARIASMAAAASAATAIACVAIGGALWRSEGGTRWLLQHVPGLTVVDVQGSFGGGDLRIGSLRAVETSVQVDVTNLHVTGLDLRWHPHPGAWVGATFAAWEADAVRVTPQPSKTPTQAAAPVSLRSPVALDVARLRIGSLAIADNAPLRDVQAALSIGADGGRLHRVDHLRFGWERVEAEGSVRAQTDAPLALDVALAAHDAPAPAAGAASAAPLPHWAASATLHGPLAGFDVAANLQGEARAGRAAPQASASAHVTPFAALPLSEVLVKTTELDLRALSDRAPVTRLQGSLRIATTKPAALDADLRNLAPAAWSAGGLPFSELTTHLEAPWDGRFIAIPALRLVFADDKGAGGELRAQGRWEAGKAQLQLDLDQVQPARLDAHLGAWRISGPLKAELDHLPPPASLWGGGAASAPASAASASIASSFDGWIAHVTGRLAGTGPALGGAKNAVAPPPMALQLDALLRADALQLKQFDLKAGTATVSATGALNRGKNDAWQGDAHAQWTQLDPGAWWRLADTGPLRDGPNLLNGSLTLHFADAPAAWQGLAGVHAKADLVLADSLLAGLALDGKASIDALGAPWAVTAEVHSGDNQAHVDGAISPGHAGADALAVIDQLHLHVDAPSLQAFAPLGPHARTASPAVAAASAVDALAATKTIPGELIAKAATKVATGGQTDDARALVPAVAASAASAARAADPVGGHGNWPTHGSAKLDVQITGGRLAIADAAHGRHEVSAPLRIVTQGELSDWVGPQFKLAKLQWSGHGSSDPQAPLEASITLVDGQMGVARIAHAQATLSGTLAQHQLQLQGEAPVSPPAWLAHLANIGKANATRLDALLQGRWQADAVNTPAWQAHLAQFDLRAANEANAATPPGPASSAPTVVNPNWVRLKPFDLSLSRDAAGDWQTLRVGAGVAEFAGLTLAWQPSFWTAPAAPGASARWSVDAALAPFSVAQLLARAQPDLGWHGDLQMTAQVHAAFDGQWHVAAQLARNSGDLSVSSDLVQDPTATKQALGLTKALLQVKAEGANWVADADVAGTRLGELTGHWTAEAPSPASLPTPGSPLHGSIKAHVEDLNVWGAWLPPGWRLGGELRTDLALSGRWGDPKLTGEITTTKLAIRNALEGIYGHDGEAAIRLTGDQAQIERFHLQGGNGELSVTGSASLGATPLAKLQLQAKQFQLLGRIDRKIVTSGDLALQLGNDAIKVDGKMLIDEGLFDLSKGDAPSLDADVEVLDASAPADDGDTAATSVPRTGRATQINLAVDLGDHLQLRGRGIDTTLKGALQITSPNGFLAVRGAVRTAGGQYIAYGQKLDVTRGEITFTGPVNDPRLDILATRPNLDIVVGVAITGTALAPHVKLMSEPEMSDADKLSWLMLGRAPETVGGADTALLQQAAMALLAGEGEAPSDQLLKRLGLTDFAVGQKTDADNAKQTVVSLGRQLSKRIYVGYERSVNSASSNWQLIYRIAQRLTIRAQAGVEATTSTTTPSSSSSWSLDAIYTWRWN